MKIIDVFSFSELYEKEVLLIKLILGDPLIHEWLIVENDYTLQGNKKGYFLEKILLEDERFAVYKEKIKIFKISYCPEHTEVNEVFTFSIEFFQRDATAAYIREHYHSHDYIIISDADECIDFTNEKRVAEFNAHIKHFPQVVELATKRYWFDFDNEYKLVLSTPMLIVQALHEQVTMSQVRKTYRRVCRQQWKNYMVFEYSHCFLLNDIKRKIETFAHTGFTIADIERALFCNHRILLGAKNEKIMLNEKFLLEKIKLTQYNSPEYVLGNIDVLHTDIINEQYKRNRKTQYPHIFTFWAITRYYIKIKIKKFLLFGNVT